MNYYNPYYMMAPMTAARPSLFGMLSRGIGRGGLSLGSIINGTQRTLGLVNQAIPVVKQISPVVKNARTMFRVMNEFKKTDTPVNTNNNFNDYDTSTPTETVVQESNETMPVSNGGPTFFA